MLDESTMLKKEWKRKVPLICGKHEFGYPVWRRQKVPVGRKNIPRFSDRDWGNQGIGFLSKRHQGKVIGGGHFQRSQIGHCHFKVVRIPWIGPGRQNIALWHSRQIMLTDRLKISACPTHVRCRSVRWSLGPSVTFVDFLHRFSTDFSTDFFTAFLPIFPLIFFTDFSTDFSTEFSTNFSTDFTSICSPIFHHVFTCIIPNCIFWSVPGLLCEFILF